MHILVIPSSYPIDEKDFSGSFFREQSLALLENNVRVGILYVRQISLRNTYNYMRSNKSYSEKEDDGLNVFTKPILNFFPRQRYLQEIVWQYSGSQLFKKYIRRYGLPDVIHIHSIFPGGRLATYIKEKYNIPFVITEHSSAYTIGKLKPNITKASSIAEAASARLAVSKNFASLLNDSMSHESIYWDVLPNMVNDSFVNYPVTNRTTQKFSFLTLSNLSKNKNVELILRAFHKQFKNNSLIRLRIGGSGSELSNLKKLCKQLDILEQVDFLGYIDRENVVRVMDQSNVFVLSSNYETFGVVIIEALALGLPVISTKCGGPEDLVDVENGILVDVGNIEEMACAMQSIYTDYSKYDFQNIRISCEKKYSSKVITAHLIKIYKELSKQI